MSSLSSVSLNNLLLSSSTTSSASQSSGLSAQLGSPTNALASASSTNPTQISQVGQLFNNLQTIQEANPGQFQQLLAGIASQMSSLATELGISTSQGQYLSQLSAEFQSVSGGADLAQLLPISPTAQSLAAQAYLKASSNSDTLQSLPSSSVYANSSSSISSLFQSINQQVRQAVASQTSSNASS